jgi:hypothetical protein
MIDLKLYHKPFPNVIAATRVSISGFITGVFLAAENNKDRPVR